MQVTQSVLREYLKQIQDNQKAAGPKGKDSDAVLSAAMAKLSVDGKSPSSVQSPDPTAKTPLSEKSVSPTPNEGLAAPPAPGLTHHCSLCKSARDRPTTLTDCKHAVCGASVC